MNTIITSKTETVTSMEVANMIGKEHSKLLRDIRRYIAQLNQSNIGFVDFFKESNYIDVKGETRVCFNITLKGCEFIAHKLTGQKGTEFTAKYIHRFHELEENSNSNYFINALQELTKSIVIMQQSFNRRFSEVESKTRRNQTIRRKTKI